jgi:sodium/potassium-transporting ATPase subunit alpha
MTIDPEKPHQTRLEFVETKQQALTRHSSIKSDKTVEAGYEQIPIRFRTLSINVTHSMNGQDNDNKKKKTADMDDSEYFATMDYHRLSNDEVIQRFNTSEKLGLDASAAETRLQRNGANVFAHRRPNYILKGLGYVFGGFCSVL